MFDEIQNMIDDNPYVSGRAYPKNVLESKLYVLYASNEGISHILDRHADPYAPGSLFADAIDIISRLEKIIQTPGEGPDGRGMIKWLEKDMGETIGFMGVARADPADVAQMKDYIIFTLD